MGEEPDRDGRLGSRAIAKGWLSAESLSRAIDLLEERRRGGERVALGRHLVELGLMDAGQVRELLSDQEKEVLVCSNPECGKRFNLSAYRPEKTYRCKACGGRLAVPGAAKESDLEVDDEAGESASTILDAGKGPIDLSGPIPLGMTGPGTVLDMAARAVGRGITIRLAGAPAPAGGSGFGRYVDAVELARGGMGAIYRAIDPELGRPVAIKVVLAGDRAGKEMLSRFLREAQITGQLQHPNIPPVFELSRTVSGEFCFTMK